MIKLFSLKQQKKDGTDPNGTKGMGQKKSSAAQLRITKGKKKWMIAQIYFLSLFCTDMLSSLSWLGCYERMLKMWKTFLM